MMGYERDMNDGKIRQNHYVLVLKAMVAIAKSDGNIQACERQRILDMMDHLQVKERDQAYVEQLMSDDASTTMPALELLPSYDFRRYLFQQALLVAYEDRVLHKQETQALADLGELLQLEPQHQEQAWRTARDFMDN